MADYTRNIKINVDVGQATQGFAAMAGASTQVKTSLDQLSNSARNTSTTLQSTSTTTKDIASQIGAATQKSFQLQEGFRAAGEAAGRLSTMLGGMNTSAGAVASGFQTLLHGASQLFAGGLNPLNIATTAVTTALQLGSTAFAAYENHLAEARRRSEALRESFGHTEEAQLRASVAMQQIEVNRLRSEGSVAQYQLADAELRRLQGVLNAYTQRIDAEQMEQAMERQGQVNRERAAAENQRTLHDQAMAVADLERGEQQRQQREAAGARARAEAARAQAQLTQHFLALYRQEDQERQQAMAGVEADMQRELQLEERFRAFQSEQGQKFSDQLHEFNQNLGSIDAIAESWRRVNAAAAAAGMQTISTSRLMDQGLRSIGHSAIENIAGSFAQSFTKAIDAVIQGKESFGQALAEMSKDILQNLFQTYAVKAIAELGEGIASLATTWGVPNPSADLHFVAAGIYAGIAGAAGLAEAGVSAAIGSGGASGQPASQGRVGAQAQGSRPSSGDQGGTVVHNYNISLSGLFTGNKREMAKVIDDVLSHR